MVSKILSANQNAEFLKQLCFKNTGINQTGLLHGDRVSRKIKELISQYIFVHVDWVLINEITVT